MNLVDFEIKRLGKMNPREAKTLRVVAQTIINRQWIFAAAPYVGVSVTQIEKWSENRRMPWDEMVVEMHVKTCLQFMDYMWFKKQLERC